MNRQDAMNDALDRLYTVGLRMKLAPVLPAFAAHGPMAAEAMSTLGYNDAVAQWVESYKATRKHLPMPPPKEAIDGGTRSSWLEALGDAERTTDWLLFFHEELAEHPWQEVLRTWVPRLIDGYAGGLTHGLIRTAYAVRAFPSECEPSTLEMDELARGLAYWASVYERMESDSRASGVESIEDVLPAIPRSTRPKLVASVLRTRIKAKLSHKGSDAIPPPPKHERFRKAVVRLTPIDDFDAAISRHSAAFCRFILAHDEVFAIPIVHTVTAPVCMRNLVPYVPEHSLPLVYNRLWQVSAAIISRFGGRHRAEEAALDVAPSPYSAEELSAKAVENGAEHAIKFTEACLREDAIRPDPVYRAASEAVISRLAPLKAG